MPIINPPKDNGITVQVFPEDEAIGFTEQQYNYIKWYLDVKPWKCSNCEQTVFGRTKRCYCGNLRPIDFVEEPK